LEPSTMSRDVWVDRIDSAERKYLPHRLQANALHLIAQPVPGYLIAPCPGAVESLFVVVVDDIADASLDLGLFGKLGRSAQRHCQHRASHRRLSQERQAFSTRNEHEFPPAPAVLISGFQRPNSFSAF